MASTEIDLFGIVHVKVEFIPVLKIYTIPILGRFVWSTHLFNVCSKRVNERGQKCSKSCQRNLWKAPKEKSAILFFCNASEKDSHANIVKIYICK